MSVFRFIDRVDEVRPDDGLTASFTLKGSEEFLEDHFGGFPVMPGVLMLEALKQASRRYLELSEGPAAWRLVSAENVKFGQFVKPGGELKITAKLVKKEEGRRTFDGRIDLLPAGDVRGGRALSAAITLGAS